MKEPRIGCAPNKRIRRIAAGLLHIISGHKTPGSYLNRARRFLCHTRGALIDHSERFSHSSDIVPSSFTTTAGAPGTFLST